MRAEHLLIPGKWYTLAGYNLSELARPNRKIALEIEEPEPVGKVVRMPGFDGLDGLAIIAPAEYWSRLDAEVRELGEATPSNVAEVAQKVYDILKEGGFGEPPGGAS